jgi:trk system potassium uptake protein TrkA
MKIVIVGAGRVGSSVAEALVSEANEITVVDSDGARVAELQSRFDLRGVVGNAAMPSTLAEAGAPDADLLIAVTASDETNLISCMIAAELFNVPRRLARVRNVELREYPNLLGEDGLKVSNVIWPEQAVTDYLIKLVEFPGALQVLEFAGGRVVLMALRAVAGSPLVGHPIRDLRVHIPNVNARIVAIFRKNRSIECHGNTPVEAGDEVFVLSDSRDARVVSSELRQRDKPVRRVMLAGGGNIGLRVARALESGEGLHTSDRFNVRIVERNRGRCQELARQLSPDTLVLNGDATDEDLLEEEGIADTDLFMALTNDDESNIMSALLAKKMGARRVIALINRRSYGELMQGGAIDIAVSPSHATLSELLKHVRRGDVVAAHSLRRGAAEALELVAHGDHKNSKVVGRRVEQIELPKGAMIGAIVRGSGDAAQVLPANHDRVIETGDHVLVFVPNKRQIPRIEKLFMVSAGFF